MSELTGDVEDGNVADLFTLRSLRSEIERWLGVLGLPTRCACGCGKPLARLTFVCHTVFQVWQTPEEPAKPLTWTEYEYGEGEDDEDDEDNGPATVLAKREEWLDVLSTIWADWLGEFESMESPAHPVRDRAFRCALYSMLVNDFVFDLRSQVEAQIARHERRDREAEQLDLFPEI